MLQHHPSDTVQIKMLVLIILLSLLTYVIFEFFVKSALYWRSKGIFYVTPWRRFGRVFLGKKSFFESVVDFYMEFSDKRYIGGYQFLRPALFVRDLDLIKSITVKDFDSFPDHFSLIDRKSDPIMSLNLFSLEGEKWKDMRSTLSPAFTSSKMKAMYTLMQDTAENFCQHFLQQVADSNNLLEIEIKEIFSKYTNDVIASCAFGVSCDSLKQQNNEFFKMGSRLSNPTFFGALKGLLSGFFPKFFGFFRIPLMPKEVTDFFRNITKETILSREKHNIFRPDLIYLLMEARKGSLRHDNEKIIENDTGFATVQESVLTKGYKSIEVTDDVITAQALVFFFAGFETSSTVLSLISYHLAINPSIQSKLQKEIDDILLGSSKVSYEDISKMKYLDQVICETLRRYPPAYVLTRTCGKDYVIKAKRTDEVDLVLEKGSIITIPVGGLHMDPQYFPEPEKFDPDRFSEENRKNIISGTYMPFGSGPRNCIGSRFALLETKALIVSLLKKFDIVRSDRTKVPLELKKTVLLNSRGGIWLGLKKRLN